MKIQEATSPYATRKRPSGPVDYPVRFFNMLCFDKPTKIEEIFKWCAIFYRSSGFLREVIDKRSRYPVTTVEVTDDTNNYWNKLLNDQLNIRETIVRVNINKNTFGNTFVSVIPLFKRYLKCPKCKAYHIHPIEKMKYNFRNFEFYSKCLSETCNFQGKFILFDSYTVADDENVAENINIKIWPTQSIKLKQNHVTGKTKIFYKLSNDEVNGILKGNKFMLETMPSDFIEAVKSYGKNAAVELEQDKTFWHKTEDIEEPNPSGFGLPFYFSAWKTMFQIFVHRKAQECIISDHMLPYRVLYPMQQGNTDPISSIDLAQWRASMSTMIQRWYNDPNEIGEMPMPVGYQQLGGQGKAMSLTAEIEDLHKSFLIETGTPPELIFGGMSWSGQSVTLRMLENSLMYETSCDNAFLKKLTNFIAAHFKRKPPTDVRLAPFKMADDIAKASMYLGLAAQGKISYQRALGVLGDNINFKEEAMIIAREKNSHVEAQTAIQEAAAIAASKAGRINATEQVISQLESQDLQNSIQESISSPLTEHMTLNTITGFVNRLNMLSDNERASILQNMQANNPEYYNQIIQRMSGQDLQNNQSANSQSLPEQKPPRSTGVNQRV